MSSGRPARLAIAWEFPTSILGSGKSRLTWSILSPSSLAASTPPSALPTPNRPAAGSRVWCSRIRSGVVGYGAEAIRPKRLS